MVRAAIASLRPCTVIFVDSCLRWAAETARTSLVFAFQQTGSVIITEISITTACYCINVDVVPEGSVVSTVEEENRVVAHCRCQRRRMLGLKILTRRAFQLLEENLAQFSGEGTARKTKEVGSGYIQIYINGYGYSRRGTYPAKARWRLKQTCRYALRVTSQLACLRGPFPLALPYCMKSCDAAKPAPGLALP